ncbi:MAG: nicotinamide riboside transporter PnuC [Azospirillum sp.]|nr:nicotinamide riboside transporter PnuC [Azospirillum sp.]
MSPIEMVATLFGVTSVWFTVQQDIRCWPTGMVMVVLFAVVFWDARLYSDAGLQLAYLILQSYGWWAWRRGNRGDALAVTRLGLPAILAWSAAAVVGAFGWGWVMATYTGAVLPYWDAYIVVGSLVAQGLLARKVLQHWLFWISADVIAVGTFATQGLYLTAGLYATFLGLSTAGFLSWRRGMAPAGPPI